MAMHRSNLHKKIMSQLAVSENSLKNLAVQQGNVVLNRLDNYMPQTSVVIN
jgi:hypothetical protein